MPNLSKSGVSALSCEKHKNAEDKEAHESYLEFESLEIVHGISFFFWSE
jgi:hypothetical protein